LQWRGWQTTALGVLLGGAVTAACSPLATPPLPPPPAPAPPAEDAGPPYYTEDEVDVPVRPLAPIDPAYPAELRAMGVEGDVEVRVLVLADGSVGAAQLLASSDDAFTAAVRDALREARFHPARKDGHPVASWLPLRLYFRLEE
jgi:protein TonB